ncbi:MAG: toll/interleukin-1 receptor domain-containing protein [Vicinamibacterales bacterium]
MIPVIGPDLLVLSQGDTPAFLYALLAERLASYLELNDDAGAPAGQSLNTVACRYLGAGNDPQDVYSALKAVMPPDNELPIPDPLIKLASIGSLNTFVSITFDSLLERAINQVRFGGQRKTRVLTYAPNRTEDLDPGVAAADRPVVFHLFGKLSAVPDYAVTEEDTLEFIHSLQNEARRPQHLFDELNQAHLFIIGCSITEWLARFFLRISRRERLLLARGKTDIVADSRVRDDAGLVLFLQQFKTGTKIFPGGGALEFVNELHERWMARHPKQEVGTTPIESSGAAHAMEEGAVFLSYASEDMALVQRIKDALERAGVDVWFDKADLDAGDEYELKIKRNIERCSLFVPVISCNCLTPKRRFFRIEWNHALSVAMQVPPSMQFILPVAVDDTSPTEPFLPDRWSHLHWHRLTEGQPTSDFVETVRRLYRNYQKSSLSRES